MAVLYADLNPEGGNRIIEKLEAQDIPYDIVAGGSVIKVPEDQALRLRMSLAKDGVPGHGALVGYEIFDHEESLGTTNFSQNVKLMRALEGELSRTIQSFEAINKARVHLVLPQRDLFSKEKQISKASIVVSLKAGQSLTKAEIRGISHLVATVVPGLNEKDITIVDTQGQSLKLGGVEEELYGSSYQEQKNAYEARLRSLIESLLEKSIGTGKVKAEVTMEMNFDKIVINSEVYDPDSVAVRSVHSSEEKERTPVATDEDMDVSVANNLPDDFTNAAGGGSELATVDRTEETTNYEVSKTIRNEIWEVGTVNKISAAVLVDGYYKTNPTTKQVEYTPRSPEELADMENLVKTAVGFKAERGDQIKVVNMRFIAEGFEPHEDTLSLWL